MRYVEITLRLTGLHSWPEAVPEVHYLASQHRHTFGFRLRISVKHGDRETEFIMLRTALSAYLRRAFGEEPLNFGFNSCEDLAERVWDWAESQGLTPIESSVSEDDEFAGGIRGAIRMAKP